MINLKVKGIDAIKSMIDAEAAKVIEKNFKEVNKRMLAELKQVTPVDKGLAQASWEIAEFMSKAEIRNTVPYIQKLNQGHSQQAPAYFIEKTALKYGKPQGTIVNNIPSA
jgi:hypothetical protein